jgi:mRNA interferase RelE/StbE
VRRHVLDAVGKLADDPRPVGSMSLAGSPGWRRIRVGAYRIVYEINDDALVVLVLHVDGRGGVYRHLDA